METSNPMLTNSNNNNINQLVQQTDTPGNFLEISIVNEMLQIIDQIDAKCKGKIGEDIVNERVQQLAYAKLLCNIYNKDITLLIKAYANLGFAYLDIEYYEQAQEHLLNAFKLNETNSQEENLNMKEFQIKILVNLSKCYLENDKLDAAKQISERSLIMNQTLFGNDHISNADIYYVLSKVNTKLKNYDAALENLTKMFNIYEKIFGYDSEKSAKISMEMGQIYELMKNYNDALGYYSNSYKIWQKIITDDNYEILFQIAIKLSELYINSNQGEPGYRILCETEEKFGDKVQRSLKDRVVFQRCKIKACSYIKDIDQYLKEHLILESILSESNENQKTLAKTCISIGYIYLENKDKDKCFEYLKKAESIFLVNGDNKLANDVHQKMTEIQKMDDKDGNIIKSNDIDGE